MYAQEHRNVMRGKILKKKKKKVISNEEIMDRSEERRVGKEC